METMAMVQIILNRRAQDEILQRMLELSGQTGDALDLAAPDTAWQDCAETAVVFGGGSTLSLQALALAEYLSGAGPWDEGGRFAGSNRYTLAVAAETLPG